VVVATLNRPDKRNAVDAIMHSELVRLPSDVQRDPAVRVLVITGAGSAFCAGGDFSGGGPAIGAWDGAVADSWTEARLIVDRLLECTKPVIAAVNGPAAGLGATVALLCDVVVAGPEARFGDTHVVMGIAAGDGGQVTWPFLIGLSRAKYYLMTGEFVPAAEAERLGLVTFLDDDRVGRALAIADRLAAGPAAAISGSKVPINTWLRAQAAQILPLSLAMEDLSFRTADAAEAQAAFREKRPPRFTGH
jgi:enoyl-CoA hydratase